MKVNMSHVKNTSIVNTACGKTISFKMGIICKRLQTHCSQVGFLMSQARKGNVQQMHSSRLKNIIFCQNLQLDGGLHLNKDKR